MKPLNKTERRSLYLQFLILYLVSILVIIIAMHFYYSIPEAELNDLRKQKEIFKTYDVLPRQLLEKMHQADSLQDMLDDPKKFYIAESNYKNTADRIKEISETLKAPFDSLFLLTGTNYLKALNDKESLRNLNLTIQANEDAKQQINKLTKDLSECQSSLKIYQMQGSK